MTIIIMICTIRTTMTTTTTTTPLGLCGQISKGGMCDKVSSYNEFGWFRGQLFGRYIPSFVLKLLSFLHLFHNPLSFFHIFRVLVMRRRMVMMMIIRIRITIELTTIIMQYDKGGTINLGDIGWWW